ncbi:MAG TPA: F0F1 ATP synthase subunit A, partial [Planctomycetota bacterium]|nr:F0F1 ATP synthase subunit A [Planctomycetota bacterium]
PDSGEIFLGLFEHLEPHAVFAVWFGGQVGFEFVKPYVTDAAGRPAQLDAHDHPVLFGSRDELVSHYQASMGGGTGWIIWNITTAQWIAAGILLLVMLLVAWRARQVAAGARRGVGFHMLEATILYVRDDMVYPVMGKHHGDRFLPLFLTQFFFILCMNLMGLVPFFGSLGGTPTSNLAVTGGMALTTLAWIHMSGIREFGFFRHWKNFIPHGVPWFVLPIIIPVEILGMAVKPAALTIRLFANMTAGHLVMLGFFGLFYLSGSLLIGWLPVAMAIGITCLELFVAFVQAYIFTYLSIIFIGASVHPEH